MVEGPAYEKPEDNPFKIFSTESTKCADSFSKKEYGCRYKRYILNLKDKTVSHEDLFVTKWGTLDLP